MKNEMEFSEHLREVGSHVAAPTPVDALALADVAIRRTRVRRGVFAGSGALAAVAVAGTAFALGGAPGTPAPLMPAGVVSSSASAAPTTSAGESAASAAASAESAETAAEAAAASAATAVVPADWHRETLGALSYALPPNVVTSGPVEDEPGVESQMWNGGTSAGSNYPDTPPYVRVALLTPDYEFYDTDGAGLGSTPGAYAVPFDLAGATTATVEVGGSEQEKRALGAPAGGSSVPVRIIVHPSGSTDRYLVTFMDETADGLPLDQLLATLSLG